MTSDLVSQLNAFAVGWWTWFATVTWQASLYIAGIALLDRFIGRRVWPQVRYAVWLLAFVKLVLPPTLASPFSIVSALAGSGGAEISVGVMPFGVGDPLIAASDAPLGAFAVLMFVWMAGVVAFAVRLVHTARRLKQIDHHSSKAPAWMNEALHAAADRIGVKRAPSLRVTGAIRSAAVAGVLRPTIYVPPGFDRDAAEHVFLHELAHIRRGDLIVNAVSIVVLGAYWFNPFVWYAVRQTGNIRELCTDASVARLLGERTIGYRTTLLSVARDFLDARTRAPSPLGFLGLVEGSTMIVERLRQLENTPWRNPRLRNAAALVAVVVIGLTVLPMCDSNRSLESIDAPEISAQKPQSTIGSAALNLWQADDPPKIVNPITPTYPAEAKATGIEGEVFVEMVIDETGKVSNVRVTQGPEIFHESAIDAAQQMTFEPGRKDGEPVAVKVAQRIVYRLSDK